jgi:hypothetical protein
VGEVAWHQYMTVKIDNEKLVGKVGSIKIKNHNIFHTIHIKCALSVCSVVEQELKDNYSHLKNQWMLLMFSASLKKKILKIF